MNRILFMDGIIKSLSKGKLLQTIFSIVLKGVAALGVILSVIGFINAFDIYKYLNFGEKVVHLIFQNLLGLGTAFIIFQILWIRSEDIRKEEDDEYKAIPISKYFIKGIGEALAAASIISGVGYMFSTWLIRNFSPVSSPFYLRSLFQPDGRFLLGLYSFFSALIFAAFIIFITYLLAELIIVQVEIARNTRELKGKK